MSELVHIDELCPHCRIPLYMEQNRSLARRGFACPTCKKGLIWIGSFPRRIQAILAFGMGGAMIFLLFLLFLLLGFALVMFVVNHITEHYIIAPIVSLVYLWIFVLVVRWVWSSQRTFLNMLIGKRLIPARLDGKLWRFDIVPERPRFRRKVGADENLEGAMSVHEEHTTTQGALSLEDESSESL